MVNCMVKEQHSRRYSLSMSWLGAWLFLAAACNATPQPEPVLEPPDPSRISLTLLDQGMKVTGEPGALAPEALKVEVADLTLGAYEQSNAQGDGSFEVLLSESDAAGTYRLFALGKESRSSALDIIAVGEALPGDPIPVEEVDPLDCVNELVQDYVEFTLPRGVAEIIAVLEVRNKCEQPLQIETVEWLSSPSLLELPTLDLPWLLEPGQSTTQLQVHIKLDDDEASEINTLLLSVRRSDEQKVAATTVAAFGPDAKRDMEFVPETNSETTP